MDKRAVKNLKETIKEKDKIEFKNYKELCEYLKEPPKDGGRNKKLQLEEWKRHFDWETEGHKYIIKRVYDKPIKKETDTLEEKILKYNLCVELLSYYCPKILDANNDKEKKQAYKEFQENLQTTSIDIYENTIHNLAVKIGLVNEFYKEYLGDHSKLSEMLNINEITIDDFYDKVSDYYKYDIIKILDKLSKEKTLFYKKKFRGRFVEFGEKTWSRKKNKWDEVDIEKTYYYKTLTDKEEKIYEQLIWDVLEEENCTNISQFNRKFGGNVNVFKDRLNKKTINKLSCIDIFEIYEISFRPRFIFQEKKSYENKLEKLFEQRILENKNKDIQRKTLKLNESIEQEKIDFLTKTDESEEQLISFLKLLETKKEKGLNELNQSYLNFQELTKNLIRNLKTNKLKKQNSK